MATEEGEVECVITGKAKVRSFWKAVQALRKVSDEHLSVEATEDGLYLRGVAPGQRMVCGSFFFTTNFFASYHYTPIARHQGQPDDPESRRCFCRIFFKAILVVLKASGVVEKVERMSIHYRPSTERLSFHVHCPQGSEKSFHIKVLEGTAFYCPFDKNAVLHSLSAPPKLLLDCCHTLDRDESDRLCLTLSRDQVLASNYFTTTQGSRSTKSQIVLSRTEFARLNVTGQLRVIISLRALKAALSFADAEAAPSLSLYFDRPTRPVIVALESSPELSMDFLLASMAEEDLPAFGTETPNLSTHAVPAPDHPLPVPSPLIPPIATQPNPVHVHNSQPLHDDHHDHHDHQLHQSQAQHEDEDDDVLPSSPPRKKPRNVLLGLSQQTLHPSQIAMEGSLAQDSDRDSPAI